MAKQLHVIHRHTSDHLNPYTGNTESAYVESDDIAKLVLGEIAVQHNETDPALYIKVGASSASTKYVKFSPATSCVDKIVIEGGEEMTGEVVFSSGSTPTTAQTTAGVNFTSASGVVEANVIVDDELDSGSTNPISNRAVTTAIQDNELVISSALNELNDRVSVVEDASFSGSGVISVAGNLESGVTVSHNQLSVNETASAATLVSEGTFTAVTSVKEDAYGHVSAVTATTFTLPASVTNIGATGDTYVNAQAEGSALTITTNAVTALTDNTASGTVADSKAIVDYVKAYVADHITSVMHFMGATGSTPASAGTGDVYIANAQFTIQTASGTQTVEIGDYIVYDGTNWSVIEKNDTGVVTSTGLTAGAMVVADSSNSITSAGTVGSVTNPIYLSNGVPTPITAAASGVSELVYGSAVTLATIEGVDIQAELPELDDELDSGSTNAVQNSAVTTVILQNEKITAAALNNLMDTKADKSEVEDLTEVVDCASTMNVNAVALTALGTVGGNPITAKVGMQSLSIAGANGLANGIEFDGTTAIEILTLDCGEY